MTCQSGFRHENQCHCFDPGCAWHLGTDHCQSPAAVRLYRIDMDDFEGVPMCEDCAQDALESGLFTDDPQYFESELETRREEARLAFADLWG